MQHIPWDGDMRNFPNRCAGIYALGMYSTAARPPKQPYIIPTSARDAISRRPVTAHCGTRRQ